MALLDQSTYSIDTDACYQDCVAGECACTLEREDGCTLNAASDCDIQSRCCWFDFWSDKALTDVNPDVSDVDKFSPNKLLSNC